MEENRTTMAYACKLKDKDELLKSSSGGAFTALSNAVLSMNGAIVCSVYNYETHEVELDLLTTVEQRNAARGSKYIQCNSGRGYSLCEKWIKEHPGLPLLVLGTGCMTAGLKKYLEMKKISENVYFVDVICHGTPSPLIWKQYIEKKEKKFSGKIKNLTFRDKRNGWDSPTALVNIGENEVLLKEYVRIFYNHSAFRPSCFKCPFTTVERSTDITIGDYWGIEKVMPDFYDSKGVSLVLVHSQKGKHLFDMAQKELEVRESNTTDCLQPNLQSPTERPEKRDCFWNDYRKGGIDCVLKKYGAPSIINKIKAIAFRYLKK